MLSDEILASLDRKSRVQWVRGQFLSFDGPSAWVAVESERVSCDSNGLVPEVGEWVVVEIVDGRAALRGLVLPRPGVGVVTSTDPLLVDMPGRGETAVVAASGLSVDVGDTVAVVWGPPAYAVAVVAEAPVVNPPAPGPGNVSVQTQIFQAVDAGSMNQSGGSWWQSQPWASSSTYGAWFYGSKIKDTIPAHAVIESVEINTQWASVYGGNPNFMLHQLASKSGTPVPVDTRPFPAVTGFMALPAEWGNALKAGGSQWGVGLNEGGWNKAKSLAQDEWSGALRITWRT